MTFKSPLKCIIIDDEQPARLLIQDYVKKLDTLELIAQFSSPLQAFNLLAENNIDLIFLDIQMPDLSGLDFIKTLQNRPDIIFITAYSEYAVEGFELEVVDYLLKPVSFERFLRAVNRVLFNRQRISEIDSSSAYIYIKADGQVHRVQKDNILFIEGLREYVTFHTVVQKIISLESLKNLESQLFDDSFIRIHKSYIVNEKHISSHSGHFVYVGGKKIPIGTNYKEDVLKRLF